MESFSIYRICAELQLAATKTLICEKFDNLNKEYIVFDNKKSPMFVNYTKR